MSITFVWFWSFLNWFFWFLSDDWNCVVETRWLVCIGRNRSVNKSLGQDYVFVLFTFTVNPNYFASPLLSSSKPSDEVSSNVSVKISPLLFFLNWAVDRFFWLSSVSRPSGFSLFTCNTCFLLLHVLKFLHLHINTTPEAKHWLLRFHYVGPGSNMWWAV